jgi:hypothetical protein
MPDRQAALKAGKLISIRGAREHNLKNVDLDLPRDSLIVMENPRSPSIRSTPRGSAATSSRSPPTRGSFWK